MYSTTFIMKKNEINKIQIYGLQSSFYGTGKNDSVFDDWFLKNNAKFKSDIKRIESLRQWWEASHAVRSFFLLSERSAVVRQIFCTSLSRKEKKKKT